MKLRFNIASGFCVLALAILVPVPAMAQQAVTAQDRTEIQALVTSYARTLGTCAANEYADLFGETGYFASGFRGQVAGRERLIAMVQSERQCIAPTGNAPAARPG